jgi:hypothetical protein
MTTNYRKLGLVGVPVLLFASALWLSGHRQQQRARAVASTPAVAPSKAADTSPSAGDSGLTDDSPKDCGRTLQFAGVVIPGQTVGHQVFNRETGKPQAAEPVYGPISRDSYVLGVTEHNVFQFLTIRVDTSRRKVPVGMPGLEVMLRVSCQARGKSLLKRLDEIKREPWTETRTPRPQQ